MPGGNLKCFGRCRREIPLEMRKIKAQKRYHKERARVELFQFPNIRRDNVELHAERKCMLGLRLSFVAKYQEGQHFNKHR
jgi:hypothetical protein